MRSASLAHVAELAGYPLAGPDLDEVASILDGIAADIEALRAFEIPDDVEPVLTFHVEPWTQESA